MRTLLLWTAIAACACSRPPPPPEPPHVVTIGDASFDAGSTCEASWWVLQSLGCSESMSSEAAFVTACNTIAFDFDFGCVAACRSTDCVRACHVRCVYGDGGP